MSNRPLTDLMISNLRLMAQGYIVANNHAGLMIEGDKATWTPATNPATVRGLIRRGLVSVVRNAWAINDAGRAALAEIDGPPSASPEVIEAEAPASDDDAPAFLAVIRVAFDHNPGQWIDYSRNCWGDANADFPAFVARHVAEADHGAIIEINHHRDPIGRVHLPCKIRFVLAERGEFYHGYTIRKVGGEWRVYSGPAGDQIEYVAKSRGEAIEEIKEMIEMDYHGAAPQAPAGVVLAVECRPAPPQPIALIPQLFTREEIAASQADDSAELWRFGPRLPGGNQRSYVAGEPDDLAGDDWTHCGTVGSMRAQVAKADHAREKGRILADFEIAGVPTIAPVSSHDYWLGDNHSAAELAAFLDGYDSRYSKEAPAPSADPDRLPEIDMGYIGLRKMERAQAAAVEDESWFVVCYANDDADDDGRIIAGPFTHYIADRNAAERGDRFGDYAYGIRQAEPAELAALAAQAAQAAQEAAEAPARRAAWLASDPFMQPDPTPSDLALTASADSNAERAFWQAERAAAADIALADYLEERDRTAIEASQRWREIGRQAMEAAIGQPVSAEDYDHACNTVDRMCRAADLAADIEALHAQRWAVWGETQNGDSVVTAGCTNLGLERALEIAGNLAPAATRTAFDRRGDGPSRLIVAVWIEPAR